MPCHKCGYRYTKRSPCGQCRGTKKWALRYHRAIEGYLGAPPTKFYARSDWQPGMPYPGYLQATYGMTPEDRALLLARQGGVCAICGAAEPDARGGLCIDHDHQTQWVRGILCGSCNGALGRYQKRPWIGQELSRV